MNRALLPNCKIGKFNKWSVVKFIFQSLVTITHLTLIFADGNISHLHFHGPAGRRVEGRLRMRMSASRQRGNLRKELWRDGFCKYASTWWLLQVCIYISTFRKPPWCEDHRILGQSRMTTRIIDHRCCFSACHGICLITENGATRPWAQLAHYRPRHVKWVITWVAAAPGRWGCTRGKVFFAQRTIGQDTCSRW